jgi:hypothetical protein
MGDINERLSWISSERMKKDVIDNKVDLFLKPPVEHFGTLNYDKFGKFRITPCAHIRFRSILIACIIR